MMCRSARTPEAVSPALENLRGVLETAQCPAQGCILGRNSLQGKADLKTQQNMALYELHSHLIYYVIVCYYSTEHAAPLRGPSTGDPDLALKAPWPTPGHQFLGAFLTGGLHLALWGQSHPPWLGRLTPHGPCHSEASLYQPLKPGLPLSSVVQGRRPETLTGSLTPHTVPPAPIMCRASASGGKGPSPATLTVSP